MNKDGFTVKLCISVHTEGSSEMIRTVLSASPTARNRERCSPGGTLARLIQTTSADISFLSVYSFSWPDWKQLNETTEATVLLINGFQSSAHYGPSDIQY